MLILLLLIPLIGILLIAITDYTNTKEKYVSKLKINRIKIIALTISIINLFLSLIIFVFFDFSNKQFQFVQEYHKV
jgi:NADH:ubiquinone oxidoreductase subunit 4 (subunit M)